MIREMKEQFDLATDHQVYHSSNSPRVFLRKIHLNDDVNNVIFRIEWNKILYDSRRIKLAYAMAQIIARDLAQASMPDNLSLLKHKAIGFDEYDV